MIWLAFAALAGLALAPALVGALRGRPPWEPDRLALPKRQLAELDRELAEGRIGASEHAAAILEVQRRLLAAADLPASPVRVRRAAPILLAAGLVPLGAAALYLRQGRPELPAMPHAVVLQTQRATEALGERLRERLATLDPAADETRQGLILLGTVEMRVGRAAAAADAWMQAVNIRFDPDVAVQAAEARSIADGRVAPETAALLRRALSEAAADWPWRKLAEARLATAGAE